MARAFKNILIDGLPRTGKKDLARKLSEKLSLTLISELQSVPEEILDFFYKDIERNALLTELSFLIQRYKQLNTIITTDLYAPQHSVFTFSLTKSKIYATYTLSNYELIIFEKIFEMLAKPIPINFDLVLITYGEPKKILKKIKSNPRKGEERISKEYLDGLTKVFYGHYSRITGKIIVFVDVSDLKNGFDENTVNNIIDYLDGAKPGIHMYNPLHS